MGVSRGMILVFLIGLIGCSLLIGSTEATVDVHGHDGAIEDREHGHELPHHHIYGYESRRLSEDFDDDEETLNQDDMVLGH